MPPYARRPTIAAGATFSSSLMRPPSPYPAYESRDVEMGSPPSPLSPLTMSSPVEPPPWIAWQEGMAQASAPELEEWCYSCVGGEDLVICGLCDRAICTTTCLDLPIKFKDIQGPSYAFACPKCHDDYYGKTPGVTVAPYFGLYRGNVVADFSQNVPAFPGLPATVKGPFSLSFAASQGHLKSLVILHFTLEGVPTAGCPASMIHEYLRAWFKGGRLFFKEISFNLQDKIAASRHTGGMKQLAEELARHDGAPVWVFVTTHADDGHGGLYHGTGGSSMPDFFFESVLAEPVRGALQNRSVTCFMLVSGGLVNYPESRSALLKATVDHGFDNLFAFTANALVPCLVSSFLVDMAHRVIVEGYPISTFLKNQLATPSIASRNTSIVHLKRTVTGLDGKIYVWAQPSMRPWGEMPAQHCPVCHSFRPWAKREAFPGFARFRCKGLRADGSRCNGAKEYHRPEGFTTVNNSDWIARSFY